MTFASPEWLLGLIAVPLLALGGWLAWSKRGIRWRRMVARRLENRLSKPRPAWVHFTALGAALAGWSALLIAMAEPESGEEWIEIKNEGRNLLFCIDISKSMLCEDVTPSRLGASRAAALEILEKFPNDRVGVLLFAGETLVQSPLTLDHNYVEQTLAQLDPGDIPYGGSHLAGAIETGITLLKETGQQNNIMVVLSDGEKSTEGLAKAGQMAKEAGVFVYALGMGKTEGSTFPDPRNPNVPFRDRSGNVVQTRLDEQALQMLAEDTDGYYSRGMGSGFLARLTTALAEMDRFQEEGKFRRVAKPAHQWFALTGILLMMSSLVIRLLPLRPAMALLALGMSLPSARAGEIEEALQALKAGDAAGAHQSFRKAARKASPSRAPRLNLSAGSAAAKAGDWEAAISAFSDALTGDDLTTQQQAHYGLGTSLFYHGATLEKAERISTWQNAVGHFEAALKIAPDDQPSKDNLARIKEYLRKTDEGGPDPDQNKEEEEPEEEKKDEEKDDQKESQSSPENEPGEEGTQDQDPQGNPKQPDEEGKKEKPDPTPGDGASNEKPDPKNDRGENPRDSPENEEGTPENQEGDPDKMPRNEKKGEQGKGKLIDDPNADPNEDPEERARRLIRQYSDLGGKAPRRKRRTFKRPAQDW
jgi:Ca-activated chloride channel family protein